jgi:hypothetical protein
MVKHFPNDSNITLTTSIPNINLGGCGYFALKLYQKVDKAKYRLVMINDFGHVVLQDRSTGQYIDSNGYHSLVELELYYGYPTYKVQEISEAELVQLVNMTGFWNSAFKVSDTSQISLFLSK